MGVWIRTALEHCLVVLAKEAHGTPKTQLFHVDRPKRNTFMCSSKEMCKNILNSTDCDHTRQEALQMAIKRRMLYSHTGIVYINDKGKLQVCEHLDEIHKHTNVQRNTK